LQEWEEFSHPSVKEGCKAFKAPYLCGKMGVITLDKNVHNLFLADRKGTGKCTPETEVTLSKHFMRKYEDPTILIAGPCESDPTKLEMWTFHPGDPIHPSELSSEGIDLKTRYTASELIDMGFTHAKVIFK
jgi:hypothetical protein